MGFASWLTVILLERPGKLGPCAALSAGLSSANVTRFAVDTKVAGNSSAQAASGSASRKLLSC